MNALAEATRAHTVTVRLPSGRMFQEPLAPARQAVIYSQIVHGGQLGAVEAIRASRPEGGKRLSFPHRPPEEGDVWLPADSPSALAKFVHTFRDEYELFVTPAVYGEMTTGYKGVSGSQVVWIDQDNPEKVDLLRAFGKPPHLVVATGGSGGVHAFWRLSHPVNRDEVGILNRKMVGALDADRSAHNPGRFLRIPGSVNRKAKQGDGADGICRVVFADYHRPPYDAEVLVEGLSDYKAASKPTEKKQYPAGRYKPSSEGWLAATIDQAEGTAPPEYVHRLTGAGVPSRGGFIRCPFTDHEDRHPSTHVYGDVGAGWFCHSCGRGGGPFHLAAAVDGWTGGTLRGSQFLDAAKALASAFGIEQEKE